jgi:FixJ family two-component response regulator
VTLQRAGYEVLPCVSGADFLAALSSEVPDCVVLDVQLRLQVAGVDVPGVFLTQSDDASLEASVLATGGMRLRREPFADEALLDAVGAALQSRRASKR